MLSATPSKSPLMNIPWTESPFFEQLLAESSYTDDIKAKIRFFSEKGYLILDPEVEDFGGLSRTIITGLAEEQKKRGSRIQDAWRFLPAVKTLACHPTLREWLKRLYQREPVPFQTLNFSVGTEQATHSDLIHFSSAPERFMAGVWFALEDVDEDNGPLHYYPGSHKLPVFDLHDIGLSKSTLKNREDQYKQYEQFVKTLMETSGFEKTTIRIKKGSCLIWSANLFHGGNPILDKSRTRHSLVTHYYFEQSRYYQPLYSDVYLGDIAWKNIVNIYTGKHEPHVYNGQKVGLPLKIKMRYFVENLLQESKLGRSLIDTIRKLRAR